MTSVEDDLKKPGFANWVRFGLGLQYMKEGLESFVDVKAKDFHQYIKSQLPTSLPNTSCNTCNINDVQPDHIRTKATCPKGQKHHTCLKRKKPCPLNVCGSLYDLIISDHVFHDPMWQNTDIHQWSSDHWEIAKCFLSSSGYLVARKAEEVDATGLLSICLNSRTIGLSIDRQRFEKAKKNRNEVTHSKALHLEDHDLKDKLNDMIAVLEDPIVLYINRKGAQDAAQSIKELRDKNKPVSKKDEIEASQNALTGIDRQIQDIQSEGGDGHTERTRAEYHTDLLNILEEQREVISKLMKTLKMVGPSPMTTQDDISTENKGLQNYLVDFYRRYFTQTDVSPLDLQLTENVETMFVPMEMERHELGQIKPDKINTYENIFCKNGKLLKNIFVTAPAGMGKSTLCKMIVAKWCKSKGTGIIDNSNTTDVDADFMSRFEFLFFVSLRFAKHETTIERMVEVQLFHSHANHIHTFNRILSQDQDKCIYIIDGLDDWSVQEMDIRSPIFSPGMPQRNHEITALYTSRPWKIAEKRLKTYEIDVEIRLKGITDTSSKQLANVVFTTLDDRSEETCPQDRFFEELKRKNLTYLQTSPLTMKLLTCSWFDNQTFSETQTAIFADIVQLIICTYIEREKEKRTLSKSVESKEQLSKQEPQAGLIKKHLPKLFETREACVQYSETLCVLGEFSLNYLGKSLELNQEQFDKFQDIKSCQKIGLLSMNEKRKRSLSKSIQVSYFHNQFQDFFAAIHVVQTPNCLEKILQTCKNRSDIAERSDLFQFICGMDEATLKVILQHFYDNPSISQEDGNDRVYQQSIQKWIGEAQIDAGCALSELPLRIVHISDLHSAQLMTYIKPEQVKSLVIESYDVLGDTNDCVLGAMNNLEHYQMKPPNKLVSTIPIDTYLASVYASSNTLQTLEIWNRKGNAEIKLTHTDVTSLFCTLPQLEEIYVQDVSCEPDDVCGCKGTSPTKQPMDRATNVKVCLLNRSDVMHHISAAPKLEHLECFDSPIRSEEILSSCPNIQVFRFNCTDMRLPDLKLSEHTQAVREILFVGIGISSASLKSLIESIPSAHPSVPIILVDVKVLASEHDDWFKETFLNDVNSQVDFRADEQARINTRYIHARTAVHQPREMKGMFIPYNIDYCTLDGVEGVYCTCQRDVFNKERGVLSICHEDQLVSINRIDMKTASLDKVCKCTKDALEASQFLTYVFQFRPGIFSAHKRIEVRDIGCFDTVTRSLIPIGDFPKFHCNYILEQYSTSSSYKDKRSKLGKDGEHR